MKKMLYAASLALLAACSGGPKEPEMSADERIALIQEIEEKSFGQGGEFNKTSALALIKNYALFADENPEDERAPAFLFKAGDISMGLEKSKLAIDYFNRVIDDYPEYEKVPYCMFLKGFVFENQIKDLSKAESSYRTFIEKYPDHDMTEAAKFSLQNLGKSPEQLIREFEEKNATPPEN